MKYSDEIKAIQDSLITVKLKSPFTVEYTLDKPRKPAKTLPFPFETVVRVSLIDGEHWALDRFDHKIFQLTEKGGKRPSHLPAAEFRELF